MTQRLTSSLVALGASALLAATALAAPTDAQKREPDYFFRPAAISSLPEDQLYPKGKQFFFSFYSTGGNQSRRSPKEIADADLDAVFQRLYQTGIRLIGPQYELNARSLDDAEKHGLGVIYAVGIPMRFHHKNEMLTLSDQEIISRISEQVKAAADNPAIKVWYIVPEELRYWKRNEVDYFNAAVAAVRQSDPHQRPLFVYDPGHRDAKSLTWIAEKADYLAKGAYVNYSKMKNQRIYVRWSIEQEQEAFRNAGKPDGLPLLVPEMFEEPAEEERPLISTWVRHDCYLGLVSGAKGILVFSARERAKFPSHDAYLKAYESVARDLFGSNQLAQVFLFGERREDLSVDVIEGPEEVEMTFRAGKVNTPVRYRSVNFLDAAYGDERFLVVVNSSDQPIRAMAGGISFASARAHSLFHEEASFVVGEGEFEIDLKPLEVKAYRFTREP